MRVHHEVQVHEAQVHEAQVHEAQVHEAQVHEAQDHEAQDHEAQDVHPAMPSALAMRFPHPCRWPLQPHQPVGLPWQTLCPVFAHGVRRVHEEVDGYVVPVHVIPANVVPVHVVPAHVVPVHVVRDGHVVHVEGNHVVQMEVGDSHAVHMELKDSHDRVIHMEVEERMEVEAHHNHEVHHEAQVHEAQVHEAQDHEAQDHEAHHEKVHHGHQDVHPAMPSALAMRFPHPCRWPLQPHQPVGLPWQTLCPVFAHGVRRVHEEVDGYVVPGPMWSRPMWSRSMWSRPMWSRSMWSGMAMWSMWRETMWVQMEVGDSHAVHMELKDSHDRVIHMEVEERNGGGSPP